MKTPEELAEEFVNQEDTGSDTFAHGLRNGFLAGYKAAKDEYKVAIDTYNDVAKQMLHEAVRLMIPTDEIAEKVLGTYNVPEKPDGSNSSNNSNGWISVKDRLPEDFSEVLIAFGGGVSIACYDGDWREPVYPMLPLLSVTYWMPLPAEPKEEA